MLRFSNADVPDGKVPSAGYQADRKVVAPAGENAGGHGANEVRRVCRNQCLHVDLARRLLRNRHLGKTSQRAINGRKVLVDDGLTLACIRFVDGVLDVPDCFFARQHTGNREEACLQHGIGSGTPARPPEPPPRRQ